MHAASGMAKDSTPAGWDARPERCVGTGLPEGQPRSMARRLPYRRLHLLTGVVLPACAIVVEGLSGWSAAHYTDPFPHRALFLLALAAPLSNLALWLSLGATPLGCWLAARPLFLRGLNALALAVSAGYALLFLPVVPVGLLLALFAIGLLPLAPFFALHTAWRLGRALHEPLEVVPSKQKIANMFKTACSHLAARLPCRTPGSSPGPASPVVLVPSWIDPPALFRLARRLRACRTQD